MDDYSALAQRVAVTVGDVRGLLVLSRDGLVLGAYPEDDESVAKPSWLKFATLGEPEKSFVEFGDQVWVYVHRGPYAAFAVAGTSVRPGILIDQLEQALLAAEDARTKREPLKLPDATSAPSGKPRTTLHPPAEKPAPAEVAAAAPAPGTEAPPAGSPAPAEPAPAEEAPAAPASSLKKEPQKLAGEPEKRSDEETEVDRVLLAQEFSGLLQVEEGGAEGSS
jgi:hypothetical protein